MNTHIDVEAALQPTRLDMAIAKVFPRWGAERVRQRRQYAYEAAVNTRLRTSNQRIQGPEDYQAFTDRIQLIKQVRDLDNNFGLFYGVIDKLANYSFGRLRYQARTGDKKTDDAYEDYLAECFADCDLSGRHNFRSMVEIAFKSMLRDGDYGLKWQRDEAGNLKMTGIEGDRIGGIYMASVDENYFQGIYVDPITGRPLWYDVYYRTKADAYIGKTAVPAHEMIHVFDPRRFDQYRGVTPFASIINEARDLKELMEALRIGTKFENYHSAVQYTASGLPLNDPKDFIRGVVSSATGQAMTETEIKYGVIQAAPIGSKVEWLKSDRPSGTIQTYMESLIRLQGVALNMPFGFLYNLSGLGGPAARMDSAQAQRVIMHHQENIKARLLERVKDTYLMEGFAKRKIRYTPKWRNGVWQFPPWPTIDVGRESTAGINEWRAGLRSKSAWFAEEGEDAEEQEAIMAAEADRTLTQAKALAEKHETSVELALTMLETRTQNGFYIAQGSPATNADGEQIQPKAGDGEASEMETTVRHIHEYQLPEGVTVNPADNSLAAAPRADVPPPAVKGRPVDRVRIGLENARRKLGVINRIGFAMRTLSQRRERLAEKDPLKWLTREAAIRTAEMNSNHEK